MKIFVTGSTGSVGSSISRALVEAGHEVLGLTSNQGNVKKLKEMGITPVVGDMRDCSVVGPPAEESDVTILCVMLRTKGRLTRKKMKGVDEAEATHLKCIVDAAGKKKRRVIHTTGFLVFGVGDDGWTDESCGFDPPGFSKGGAETSEYLLNEVETGKINGCVIAPGFVYGPSGFFVEIVEQIKAGKFGLPGGGHYYWSPINSTDLANAYLAALDGRSDGKVLLLVDDQPMLMRDIMFGIADQLKVKRPGNFPKLMAKIFLGGAMVEGITTSRRCRNDLAKKILGWSPKYTKFEDGLPDVLEALH